MVPTPSGKHIGSVTDVGTAAGVQQFILSSGVSVCVSGYIWRSDTAPSVRLSSEWKVFSKKRNGLKELGRYRYAVEIVE